MGVQYSTPCEGPPEVLEGRDIPSIVKYMKSDQCRKVFVMLGAGVSTSAGIPDFRTPGTGLYSNLARLNLPYPEAVFEINYFRQNPLPFFTLACELYPGKFRPTPTHTFVKLLSDKKLLDTCFTQNIDTLERQANIPGDQIVEAHGSFADQHCIDCHRAFDGAKMKAAVEKAEAVHCPACNGLVKPDIVFFGESLPPLFREKFELLRQADLLFVIGTSLKVHPFASLTLLIPEDKPRVLINMEPAGDIGTRPEDVVLLGHCDEVVRELCAALGWGDDLDREWGKTELLNPLEALDKSGGRNKEGESLDASQAKAKATERKDAVAPESGPAAASSTPVSAPVSNATPEEFWDPQFLREQQAELERIHAERDQKALESRLNQKKESEGEATTVTDSRVDAEVERLVDQIGKVLDMSKGNGREPKEPTLESQLGDSSPPAAGNLSAEQDAQGPMGEREEHPKEKL